jgi:hypothetical protein
MLKGDISEIRNDVWRNIGISNIIPMNQFMPVIKQQPDDLFLLRLICMGNPGLLNKIWIRNIFRLKRLRIKISILFYFTQANFIQL